MWSPSIISPTGKWEEMYMGTANVFIHWEVLLECGQPQTGERMRFARQEYEDGEGREWEGWGQASIRASSPASTAKVEDGVQWDRWGTVISKVIMKLVLWSGSAMVLCDQQFSRRPKAEIASLGQWLPTPKPRAVKSERAAKDCRAFAKAAAGSAQLSRGHLEL